MWWAQTQIRDSFLYFLPRYKEKYCYVFLFEHDVLYRSVELQSCFKHSVSAIPLVFYIFFILLSVHCIFEFYFCLAFSLIVILYCVRFLDSWYMWNCIFLLHCCHFVNGPRTQSSCFKAAFCPGPFSLGEIKWILNLETLTHFNHKDEGDVFRGKKIEDRCLPREVQWERQGQDWALFFVFHSCIHGAMKTGTCAHALAWQVLCDMSDVSIRQDSSYSRGSVGRFTKKALAQGAAAQCIVAAGTTVQ